MKRAISQHAFGQEPPTSTQLEYTKPIVVPAGRDSLRQIGHPPGLEGVTDRARLDEAWARTFQVTGAPQRGPSAPARRRPARALHRPQPLASLRASSPLKTRPPPFPPPACLPAALLPPLHPPQALFPPSAESQRASGRERKRHVVDSDAYGEEAIDGLRAQKLKELSTRAARARAEAAAEASAAAARGAGRAVGLTALR